MCNTLCTLVIIILPHPLVRHTHVPFLSSRALHTIQLSRRKMRQKKAMLRLQKSSLQIYHRERIFMGFTVFYSQAGNFCSVWNPSIILLHMKKYIALIPKNNLKEGKKRNQSSSWQHQFQQLLEVIKRREKIYMSISWGSMEGLRED